ncbi:ATP-dependent Clp protease adaptor ClpS [Trichothermofontia sichuanensis B231]|uniref:ATP-dependent Clp protease adaptor ClpS n=1 Tax=Trichothermofontia sichuanensis TaxID=3045816 RepID=UPI002245A50C|nr:ATP-dependent Clp protease adaptor ClpS [Trichothermofontia sichuanensis]UZQ55819.1 ATP-dependent Clp protease adaptor ClpS [Trichothermofontia sichuanensis B231]
MVPNSSPDSLSLSASRSHWQHRQVLLQRVRHYWIEGVLATSQQDQARLEIALVERWDLVGSVRERTWDAIARAERPLPMGTSLMDYWQRLGLGSSLLILGAAGAGKTTALLELGRDLLDRATLDPEYPLPIILSLASWRSRSVAAGASPQTWMDWLLEELRVRYQLSPTITLSWLDGQNLVLLLDGLDEVPWPHRQRCIAALNDFKQRHSLLSMVVCSRLPAYLDLGEHRLHVQSAIALQPLSWEQVQNCLTTLGPELAAVKAWVDSNPALQELLTTPLMLRLLIQAGTEAVSGLVTPVPTAAAYRTHLLNTYVDHLLGRPDPTSPLPPSQLRYWLARLAYRLTQQSQTLFALDNLQPQWLRDLEGGTDGLFRASPSPNRPYRTYVTGIVLGCGLVGASLGVWLLGPGGIALGGGLGAAIGWQPRVTDRIEPVTQVWWSWEAASRGVVIGGLAGLSAGFTTGTLGGGLLGLISGGVMGGWLGGLVRPQGSRPREGVVSDPNHGIWRSLQNAAVFAGVGAVLGGMSGAGFAWLVGGDPWQGLLTGGLLTGSLLGLHKGGLASLKHGWLRWLLYRQGELPWNVRQLLEAGAERLCLHQVGGHYAFIHRLLQTHFAAMLAEEYSERIHLNPNDADAYAQRAALYATLGDLDAAAQDYDRVIALQPDWLEAYAARSWLRYQRGDYPGTLADYAFLLDRAPALAQSLTYKPTAVQGYTSELGTDQVMPLPASGQAAECGRAQDSKASGQAAYPTDVLTVLNDDIHSFEQVIAVLSHYLPGVDRDRARQLAQRIHQEGKAIVWEGPVPLVALYQIQLQQMGLTVVA